MKPLVVRFFFAKIAFAGYFKEETSSFIQLCIVEPRKETYIAFEKS